jgi:hypothetical protein
MSRLMSKAINSLSQIYRRARCAFAEERRHRMAIERELFGGRIRLSSKNDDDLPSVR